MFSDVQALLLKHHLRYTAPGTRSSRTDDYVLAGKHAAERPRGNSTWHPEICRVDSFEDIASQTATKHSLSGYAYKIVALTFSSFEEVLLLDADNVVMRSPRQLFESEQYKYTGSLLWKDFWLERRAPEASMIGAKALPGNNTHESGQLLVNKKQAWKALMLSHYMNNFPNIFYPLSVNFMGLGDKELFALATRYLGN